MEYQQFTIYCRWKEYERREGLHAPLMGDEEAIRRGVMESSRSRKEASRQWWRGLPARVMAMLCV